MLYNLKYKERITDLMIWFDENAWTEPKYRTPELEDNIYRALWLCIHNLAVKKHYFERFYDYENFASWLATDIYMSIYKKITSDKPYKKIKSIKNYLNSALRFRAITYREQYYNQIFDKVNTEGTDNIGLDIKSHIEQQTNYMTDLAINSEIECISSIIVKTVKDSPYSKDRVITNRLIKSCYLTIISQITMSNPSINYINKYSKRGTLSKRTVRRIYGEEKNKSLVLWKLDRSYSDYVRLLCNKILKTFTDNLHMAYNEFRLSDDILEKIMYNSSTLSGSEEE